MTSFFSIYFSPSRPTLNYWGGKCLTYLGTEGVDPRYFRPTEVEFLQADITKAKTKLGWEPRVTFEELVKIMVDCDVQLMGLHSPCEGLEASKCKGFNYTNHVISSAEQIRER